MLQKIQANAFRCNGPIKILYPGLNITQEDSGIGSIGRIDHASFHGKHHIGMHPHVNDEILSYFRSGKVEHRDSEGFREVIEGTRLMLMKAGKLFYHEEFIDGVAEPHEGLQIFIRPGAKDLKPEVTFYNLEQFYSENEWRLIASPTEATTLHFSSQTWLYDMKLLSDRNINLPQMPGKGLTGLLYVFQGSAQAAGIDLKKREVLVFRDEDFSISTMEGAELVLFLTDENAPIFKAGMYSGNQIS